MNLLGIWESYNREACHLPDDADIFPRIAIGPDQRVWLFAVQRINYVDELGHHISDARDYGLVLFEHGHWNFIRVDRIGQWNGHVTGLACDWTGALWLNMTSRQVSRFDGSRLEIFRAGEKGLPPESGWWANGRFASGDEGNFWLAVPDIGACRFTGTVWEYFTSKNSQLPDGWVTGVTLDGTGHAWFAVANLTRTSFVRYDGNRWEEIAQLPIGRKQYEAHTLAFDHQERMWVGWRHPLGRLNKQGLWALNLTTGSWSHYNSKNSALPGNDIKSLAVDMAGRIWVGTQRGLAVFEGSESGCWKTEYTSIPSRPLRRQRTYGLTGKNSHSQVSVYWSVGVDAAGHIWANAHGLNVVVGVFSEIQNSGF